MGDYDRPSFGEQDLITADCFPMTKFSYQTKCMVTGASGVCKALV
jgi:hypothetical protein